MYHQDYKSPNSSKEMFFFQTPILLITFNRPDYTRRVLEAVLAVNPMDLYIFQDGAREGNEGDLGKCSAVRQVIDDLTETIQPRVHTYYSEKNLGCGRGPLTAISWFFQNVEQGIIFEDDCIPHHDFFPYCEELLEKYKNDRRISFIGGCNFEDKGKEKDGYSYGFCSGHHETWGWATWRRSWLLMDYTLKGVSKKDFKNILNHYIRTWKHREYWWWIYGMVKKDQMNGSCWDYQFYFSCWLKNMMAIYPKFNLVSNVGSGNDATHTKSKTNLLLSRESVPIMPLVHPDTEILDVEYDYRLTRYFDLQHEYGLSGIKRFPYHVNRWLKRILGHQGSWMKGK